MNHASTSPQGGITVTPYLNAFRKMLKHLTPEQLDACQNALVIDGSYESADLFDLVIVKKNRRDDSVVLTGEYVDVESR